MRFHTNLPVRNLQKTVPFYETLFGTPATKTKKDYAKFLAASETLNISFHETVEASLNTGLHLGFEFPDQNSLDAAFQRLSSAGMIPERRETSICCYANQDKFWLTDPDGYRWELYVLLEDTVTKIERKTSCCVSSEGQSRAPATPGCC